MEQEGRAGYGLLRRGQPLRLRRHLVEAQPGYVSGPRVITPDVKDNMKAVLEDIQKGNFSDRFIKDNENNFEDFHKLREEQHGHQIEAVGRDLREMMPFIKSKSIEK